MQQKFFSFNNNFIHNDPVRKCFWLLILLLVCTTNNLFSQNTWTGLAGNDWNNSGSWSDGIPDVNDNVIIPNMSNYPRLSNPGAAARSVTIQSGGRLEISSTGTLMLNGGTSFGLRNQGTCTNSGTIIIGASLSGGTYGIDNQGAFTNTGIITIRQVGTIGIVNTFMVTFTNQGTLNIGPYSGMIQGGIFSNGTFSHVAGQINIDGCTDYGIGNNSSGIFNNTAAIVIGATGTVNLNGIHNYGTFNNNVGGQIMVDRCGGSGIQNTAGTFTNTAVIVIGATAGGGYGVYNNKNFNNTNSGQIRVDRVSQSSVYNTVGGTFNNQGSIIAGANGSAGPIGCTISGIFNNNTGAQITIDRSTGTGLQVGNGTFTNQSSITVGATASVGTTGIAITGTFHNNAGGHISIDRSTHYGIDNLGTFNNRAAITIGASASPGNYGIQTIGTFNNYTGGEITIDRAIQAGIISVGNFNNQSGITIAQLVTIPALIRGNANTFNNNAGGTVKGAGTIWSSVFTNSGGTLSPGYSPGKLTFDTGENFSTGTLSMEVNGTGLAGTHFDQIEVTGTATLSGTLAVSVNYTPTDGDQVPILTATALSGTFASVTGLPAGWTVGYNTPVDGQVSLTYSLALPVELTGFTARLLENQVRLDWQTASEHNNAGFSIERSSDGLQWSEIGFVAGKGDATEVQQYDFADENPLPALNYYRLRQVDYDGKAAFSRVVSLRMPEKTPAFSIFPNPVLQGKMLLHFPEAKVPDVFEVFLFDTMGKLVKSAVLEAPEMDVRTLPPGTYLLEVRTGGRRFAEKVVVY